MSFENAAEKYRLAPCPFCGSPIIDMLDGAISGEGFSGVYVGCRECGASGQAAYFVHHGDDRELAKEAAAKLWNRRPMNGTAELRRVGEQIAIQDNRLTQDPIFIVEEKVRDYGYHSDYASLYTWFDEHTGETEELTGEAIELLDQLEDEDRLPEGMRKVYYKERWEFVTACFTEQGCADFLKVNGHNLGEARIYAAGSFRNEEFLTVRRFLLSLVPEAEMEQKEAA